MYTNETDKSGTLFDAIKKRYKLTSDEALAKKLETTRSAISMIRNGKRAVTAAMILRVCKATGMSLPAVERHLPQKD